MPIRYVCLLFCFLFSASVYAQQAGVNEADYRLSIKRSPESVVVDGRLDEVAWQTAGVVGNFWQVFPYDTSRAGTKTEVRVLFND